MDLGLRDKKILVTGASKGIGRACAIALAAEGAEVIICARDAAALEKVRGTLPGGYEEPLRRHRAFAVDLMHADGPARLMNWLSAQVGTIDGVVHNLGGTLGVRDPLATLEQWRRVWRLNLEVAIEINASLIPQMQREHRGKIIFVSSLAAFEHQGSVPYSVVKAALTAYVRGVGRTYAADGIVAAAVVPGVILSEGGHWDESRKRDPAYVEKYIQERLPRGDFGTAEEVAVAVTFLCSDLASAFVGSIVPLEGGQGRSFFGQ